MTLAARFWDFGLLRTFSLRFNMKEENFCLCLSGVIGVCVCVCVCVCVFVFVFVFVFVCVFVFVFVCFDFTPPWSSSVRVFCFFLSD